MSSTRSHRSKYKMGKASAKVPLIEVALAHPPVMRLVTVQVTLYTWWGFVPPLTPGHKMEVVRRNSVRILTSGGFWYAEPSMSGARGCGPSIPQVGLP